ncbi:MAG: hypothetical protein ABFS03_11280, partial [Chloroflexota bacterium]
MSQYIGDLKKPFFMWFFANILGFCVLGIFYYVIPQKLLMSGIVVSTLLISIPIGFAQWTALRRILNTSFLWIFTVQVGFLLAILIKNLIPDRLWELVDDESIAVLTAGYLVIGFAVGLPQWLVLRQQLPRSSFWLLGSAIGLFAGFWLILITDLVHKFEFISYIAV